VPVGAAELVVPLGPVGLAVVDGLAVVVGLGGAGFSVVVGFGGAGFSVVVGFGGGGFTVVVGFGGSPPQTEDVFHLLSSTGTARPVATSAAARMARVEICMLVAWVIELEGLSSLVKIY